MQTSCNTSTMRETTREIRNDNIGSSEWDLKIQSTAGMYCEKQIHSAYSLPKEYNPFILTTKVNVPGLCRCMINSFEYNSFDKFACRGIFLIGTSSLEITKQF